MDTHKEVICVVCRRLFLLGKLNLIIWGKIIYILFCKCSQSHALKLNKKRTQNENMKQFARLFRTFLESTQKQNSNHRTVRWWTLSRLKRNAFGKYLLVTNTLSSGILMVAGGF